MTDISAASITHRKDEKNYITNYWQKRSTDFANLRKAELHSEKQLLWQQEINRHLPQNRRLKILDIGCGAGFFGILLGQKHNVTGIDLTPEMIDAARTLAAAEGSSASFAVMDAEALDFAANSFDVVISRNVMWNLPHPETAYREWLRALKPGGLLLNYDAEYARGHHSQKLPRQNAHAGIAPELLDECHNIYHMLDISTYNRPEWDEKFLTATGLCSVSTDTTVGSRIYAAEDIFYIPVPMFCVKAVKL